MKQNLKWYLLQEKLLNEKEESEQQEADSSEKYGSRLTGAGGVGKDFQRLFSVWRKNYKVSLAISKPSELYNNLGISKNRDWQLNLQQIVSADKIGTIVDATENLKKGVVQIILNASWPRITRTKNDSLKYIMFWIAEMLRGTDPSIAKKDSEGKVRPYSISGFKMYMKGNVITIVKG